MNKLYDRIYWHNNTTPALNESNLNSMSKAIDDIDDRVIQLADDVVDDIADIHQWHDDCYQYQLSASQSASDAQGYASSASTSAQSADDFAEDSEAWAVGKRDGSDVPSTDVTYHNNAKYYAEHTSQDAEAWAVGERGGIPVDPSDDTYRNNSKWYSNQSGASATQAGRSVQDCEDIKNEIINMIGGTTFTVDFSTGELIYTNNATFNFFINTTTGNLEWEVVA